LTSGNNNMTRSTIQTKASSTNGTMTRTTTKTTRTTNRIARQGPIHAMVGGYEQELDGVESADEEMWQLEDRILENDRRRTRTVGR
jgi:hypothetical protein